MIPFSGVFKSVANGLSRNSEALLVFGLGMIALALFYLKVNEWIACFMPLGLYMMYIGRQERNAKHEVSLAEYDLRKLEASRNTSLAKAYGRSVKASPAKSSVPLSKGKK